MNSMLRQSLLATSGAIALAGLAPSGHSAVISWGSAFNFTHTNEALFLNTFDPTRNGGVSAPGTVSLVGAYDYGDTNASPTTINGMSFAKLSGNTDFWGNTGIDPDIDAVLSGHAATGTSTFTLNLTDLVIGRLYQIQLIGIHDSRTDGGINQRQYEVSFGGSDYTTGGTPVVLTRAGYGNTDPPSPPTYQGFLSYGTVVGTFTADATTQSIELRSNTQDGNSGDDVDPGLGGYILHSAVPEPSAAMLGGLGLLALLRRRRA